MYLPFEFKQYPRTELANGLEKTKWQHLLGIRLFKDVFFLAKQEEIGKKHMDSGWAYDVFSTWIGTLLIFVVWLKINFGEASRFEREKKSLSGTKSTFVASY